MQLKKSIVTMLTGVMVLTAGVGVSQIKPQSAHASLIGKAFMITYLYKNRNTVKEMFEKARGLAHTKSWPHFKRGSVSGNNTKVYVVTKNKTRYVGNYPSKLVNLIASGDSDVKTELQKIGI